MDYMVTAQVHIRASAKNKKVVRSMLKRFCDYIGSSGGCGTDGFYKWEPKKSKILKIEPVGEKKK